MANLKTPAANLKTPTVKKLLNPVEDPPTASSSEDDEVETSSGEDEEQISDSKIPSTQTLKSPAVVSAAAKQDSDSGSETDSESESEPPEKAISVTVKSKKKEGNASPVKKRRNEGNSREVNVKRAKKVSGDEEKKSEEDNKKPFQRLWSEEDEISLLQGMVDFKAETGTSPYDDMNKFYDKVKKCISFEVSKSQFGDKIRGLKKKYFGGKKKKRSVESSHDKKCLELAKYIWGSDGMGLESSVKSNKVESDAVVKTSKKVESDAVVNTSKKKVESDAVVKSKGKEKKVEKVLCENVEKDEEVVILGGDLESSSWFEKSFLVRFIASLGVDECSVKRKWSKVPVETKKRMEEKFKLAEASEYELLLLKTDMLKEVATVISEAI